MFRRLMLIGFAVCLGHGAEAQIPTGTTSTIATGDRYTTLEEQLINRLRASAEDQRNYLRFVVDQVERGRIDIKLVVGIERYAIRRNPSLPFPFFERAFRFQAARQGITVPPVRQFATARNLTR